MKMPDVPSWNQHIATLCCYSCGLYTLMPDCISCSNHTTLCCLDCGNRCGVKDCCRPQLVLCKDTGHCLCVNHSGYFPTRECGGAEPIGCSVCGFRLFVGAQPPANSYRCWCCCQYLECYRGDSLLGCSFDDQCLCISGQGNCASKSFQLKIRNAVQTLCLVSRCGLPSDSNYPCGLGLCDKHCLKI